MKLQESNFILGTLLFALLVAACGTLQIDVESQPTKVDPQAEPGLEVLVARDLALAHVREKFPASAPAEGELWSGQDTTPQDLLGSVSYTFTSGDWDLIIQYPIVAPEAVVYTIELSASNGFTWRGQVDAQGNVSDEAAEPYTAVAWLGHIASAPTGTTSPAIFQLGLDGVAEFSLVGATEEIEQKISGLRDAEGVDRFVNVWGLLACEALDSTACTLTAERVQNGTNAERRDEVDGWEGVIYSGPPGPRSGGDDYFVLVGAYPVEYGIWSMDETVRGELEALRGSGQVIRVHGQLLSGVPDWNNTQIQVEHFERVDAPSGAVPPAPSYPDVEQVEGWLTYTNDRYGYRIQYPPEASVEESGIQGYVSDENGMPIGGLPEGVTLDTYFQYLEQTYGNNLCIQIRTSLGYIMINAPENEGFKYANCGRTGVGVATITEFELEVQVDGKSYTARGMDIQGGGESLAEHNEDVILMLDDGTRIEFGPLPTVNATFEEYLMKGRPLLLSILATYVSTR